LNNILLAVDVSLQVGAMVTLALVSTNMIRIFSVLATSIRLVFITIAEYLYTGCTVAVVLSCLVDAIGHAIHTDFPDILNTSLFKFLTVGFAGSLSLFVFIQNIILISYLSSKDSKETLFVLKLCKIIFASDLIGILCFLLISFVVESHSLEYYCLVDITNATIGIHGCLMIKQCERIIAMSFQNTKKRVLFTDNK
jgi:hypothetical protein